MKNYKSFLSSMTFVLLSLILAGLAMPAKSLAILVADANGPYTVESGMTVTFDGSGSYSTDGEIISYEWDLDNDGEYDDASGATVLFGTSGMAVGTYTIGLKVTDWWTVPNATTTYEYSNYDYDFTTLTITEAAPIPEPTTMILFGTGIAGLAAVGRRRK